mgnify:CR=1 FL=1
MLNGGDVSIGRVVRFSKKTIPICAFGFVCIISYGVDFPSSAGLRQADLTYLSLGIILGAFLYFAARRIFERRKSPEKEGESGNSTDAIGIEFRPGTTSGIGTGVIHLFQLIKDNIGEDKTFVAGYCHLLGLACEHLGFDAAAAFVMDQHGKLALKGFHNLQYEPSDRLSIEPDNLIREMSRYEVPRFYDDPAQLPPPVAAMFKEYSAAWLVPLIPNRQFAGILIFAHKRVPSQREIYFPKLDFIGIAAGWFYENHNKERLIEKENKKNAMLVNTSLAISSSLELDEVCRVLVTHLGGAFGCSFSYVMLNSDSTSDMYVQAYYSERGGEIFTAEERMLSVDGMSWLQEIVMMGTPTLLEADDIAKLPDKDASLLKIKGSAKTLIAPLKHAGKLTGILIMVEQRSAERTRLDNEVVDLCAALVAQAAAAIANARLYLMVSDRVAQIKTMFDVGLALNSDLDLIPFFEKVLNAISENFKFSTCSFFTRDFDTDELCLTSITGGYPENVFGKRLAIGKEGITGFAAATGKIINVGDVSKDERFVVSTGNTASELAVPVILNGVVVGVLDVESDRKYAFGKREEDLLASIADQVAAAYEKIKLKQLEKERAQKLALINGLVKRLSGMLDESQLLDEAVKGLTEGFGFDHAAVFVPTESGALSLARQSCRYGDGYEPGTCFEMGEGLIGKAALQMTSMLADDMKVAQEEDSIGGIRSRFCLPLIAGYDFFGVLDLNDRRLNSFSSIDVSTIQTFAEFLAVAISNIKLYRGILEKANRLALVDRIYQAISATLEIDELFHRIAKTMSELTDFHMSALVIKNDAGYSVHSEYMKEGGGPNRNGGGLDFGSLKIEFEKVLSSGESLFVPAGSLEAAVETRDYFLSRGINYLAICPIRQRNAIKGFLVVGNTKAEGFSGQDKDLLRDVSAHLEIALNNAQLYSEIKDAYVRLNDAQEKLIQAERLKALGEVAAGIAHDFKNILAAVVGRAQLLRHSLAEKGTIPEETLVKGLKVIEKSATDGVNILSRINEFTKNKSEAIHTAINLGEIINDSIEMARARWEGPGCQKSIEISTKFGGDLQVQGDRAQMIEVFNNLILNAVDAIGKEGKIGVTAETIGDEIKISVSDDGSGMEPQVVKRIFDPFFTTKGRNGTGLGLTMAYAIIKGHNGEITVESSPGRGTTFHITLPRIPERRYAGGGLDFAVLSGSGPFVEKILNLIAESGHRGEITPDIKSLKRLIGAGSIRAVIVDIDSPGGEASGLVERLRTEFRNLPIIPVTSDSSRARAYEAVWDETFCLKNEPSDLERFNALVGKIGSYGMEHSHVK